MEYMDYKHLTAPVIKNYLVQNVNSAETEKPWIQETESTLISRLLF
jgi:hypothetical protein